MIRLLPLLSILVLFAGTSYGQEYTDKEWTRKIYDLVIDSRTAMIEMGHIAYQDNPFVGVRIQSKLNDEITRATKIYTDYKDSVTLSRRHRRQAGCNGNGNKAFNEAGKVLVGSDGKIAPEKSQLSGGAQGKMDGVYDKAVKDCKADYCQGAAASRDRIKEAKAAKG